MNIKKKNIYRFDNIKAVRLIYYFEFILMIYFTVPLFETPSEKTVKSIKKKLWMTATNVIVFNYFIYLQGLR